MSTDHIHVRYPEKLSKHPQMALATTLKIPFSAKDNIMILMGGHLWDMARKSTVTRGQVVMQIKPVPSPLIKFSCDLQSTSSWYREGDTYKWSFQI